MNFVLHLTKIVLEVTMHTTVTWWLNSIHEHLEVLQVRNNLVNIVPPCLASISRYRYLTTVVPEITLRTLAPRNQAIEHLEVVVFLNNC